MTQAEMEQQRAIGRIEGQNVQILEKLNAMIVNHIKHEDQDRQQFEQTRKACDDKLEQLMKERRAHDAEQDSKIARLERMQQRAQGAGWVILGLLAVLAGFLGTAILSIFNGHVIVKWH